MKNYAVIGSPIKHSMSPYMHNEHFSAQSDAAYYSGYDVCPSDLPEAVRAFKTLGVSGWNVTVPHKVDIMNLLDDVDIEAKMIGAVNTVVNDGGKLTGYNTDGKGFLNALLAMTGSEALREMNVLMIGAGGAARAVAYSLLTHGVKSLSVVNRTEERAEKIAADFASIGAMDVYSTNDITPLLPQFDCVINTTSIGLQGEQLTLIDSTKLRSGVYLSDLIYNPSETAWLKTHRTNARAVQNGLGMFIEQAALAYELWSHREANRTVMKQTVERKLGIPHAT
ncbi:shikimate 5-dehydrogenase I alpha [Geomicrobium sp. JCM 19037]|uniref:shikimate dehydrogenase n=1 Tax=unclassified Geomicrobium TaxID=2628951 RepID=UPI00045F40B6|nr:shikimate dehydrogenase [Geomicrobium sp. JCM 19037]GAK04143.1 shikimate 5-dehydrogenase I alpha [Geomicrobium sp. JCM 19037]